MDPAGNQQQVLGTFAERGRSKDLSSVERKSIISHLLLKAEVHGQDVKLPRGAVKEALEIFHVCRTSIWRVWLLALSNFGHDNIRSFKASPNRKGNSGRKQFWDREQVRQEVVNVSLNQRRRTIRSLANALQIPKSSLYRMKQDKDDPVIRPASIALKLFLTEQKKLQRVLYCAENLNPENRLYKSFYNHVHINEKWLFVCKKDFHVYLGIDSDLPHRMTQNTTQMICVMFHSLWLDRDTMRMVSVLLMVR